MSELQERAKSLAATWRVVTSGVAQAHRDSGKGRSGRAGKRLVKLSGWKRDGEPPRGTRKWTRHLRYIPDATL